MTTFCDREKTVEERKGSDCIQITIKLSQLLKLKAAVVSDKTDFGDI
jgi:hypothetical protein